MSRWPTLAGIALAVLVARDLAGGVDLAPVLAASGLVYLATAALGTPAAAWPMFFATFAVIAASRMGLGDFDATWAQLALAVPLLAYGMLRGETRPTSGLPLQAVAMLVVGAMAAAALTAGGDLGGYLVAAGLLGHAGWDVHHHRTNRVVPRSMAEFCGVLDTLLAVAIVAATVQR